MDPIKQLYNISKDLDVLFVEDDDGLRVQMEGMFKELFHKVDTAQNGKVGLQKYQDRFNTSHTPYDLVITDINMPEMNGIEMIHAIYQVHPSQSIIVVSAHNESDYLIELLRLGINSFLIKPVKHNEMINTLYSVIKALVNERLVESHYHEVEELNRQLRAQDEELKKRNNDLREKNIALEKSMRIIEGMHHKDKLNRKFHVPVKLNAPVTNNEEISGQPKPHLKEIESIINNIAIDYRQHTINEEALNALAQAINNYADSLDKEEVYANLRSGLKQLGTTLSNPPECSCKEEVERIFNMLESFFFIYSKWEHEWENIDNERFQLLSSSIENEIYTLIDVWKCKI